MVNLDELKKKYEQIQRAQSGGGGNSDDFLKKFFMMDEGTSIIRVLPSPEGTEQEFYAETAIHRINDKNYHCPRVKGHDCPICDLYYKLWKVEGPMKDEAQDLARQIKPRKRYYMNVVDRRDESVKILSMGMKLFGAGKLVKPDEKDASLKFVYENDLVDAITVGALSTEEVDDTLSRMNKALRAV